MARRVEVIGEFNGLAGGINPMNGPGDTFEIFQNWRFDEQGVLMPRYGTIHGMVCQSGTQSNTLAIAEIYAAERRILIQQTGGEIFYIYSEKDESESTVAAEGEVWDFQRPFEPAAKHPTIPYKHLTKYNAVPVKATSTSWPVGSAGTGSITFQNGTGPFGSNGAYISNTSIQQISPFIMGIEMVVDSRVKHRWVYGEEGDWENEQFAAVTLAATESQWQFRYIYQDGSRGPLSTAEDIPRA